MTITLINYIYNIEERLFRTYVGLGYRNKQHKVFLIKFLDQFSHFCQQYDYFLQLDLAFDPKLHVEKGIDFI